MNPSHRQYRPFSTRPHTYGVRPWSCPAIATEPCRPTACVRERPCSHNGQGGLGETPSYRALAPFGANGSPTIVHCSFYIVHCTTYTFSAKERDSETGLSYFGSRYYSSDLSIWLSVDPMASKYPSLSPYVYCADNPVKLVDPNGEEIWEIDEEGRIVNHDKSYTKNDVVYRVDKDGKRIDGQSLTLDYRTIEKQKSISYSPDGKTVDTYDMYQVRGDENGKKFFEFMAEAVSNAGIEVTHIQCGVEGGKGLNFITLAHERSKTEIINGESYTVSSEKSGWNLFISRLKYGYTIRTWNHSHPQSTKASPADFSLKNAANKILQRLGRSCPQYNIYHVPSKTPIPY